ncbi:MAG: S41 family peptidase [Thermoleophilia bacterium]
MPRFFRGFFITLAISVAFLSGSYFGGHYYRLSPLLNIFPAPVRNAFFPGDNTLQIEREIEGILQEGFYQPVDQSTLENGAMEGMVKSLNDPYTAYFSPDDYRLFNDHSNGQFTGIGVLMEQKGESLTVVQVFDNTPAQESGIESGDIIREVDGKPVQGMTEEETSGLMRGPEGTTVTLKVLRGAAEPEFTMTRRIIDLPIVSERMIDAGSRKIGYVRLDQFSLDSGVKLRGAVDKLVGEGAEGIVFDLRNNGGGLLDESINVASTFIQDGPIVSVVGRDGKSEVYSARGDANETIPLMLLVNGYSASASEIVAGAIKDDARGKLVGEKTFGKGVVQSIVPLSNGGGLKYTAGSYYTPRGIDINKIGIEPDIPVVDDPATPADEVLDRAVAELAR